MRSALFSRQQVGGFWVVADIEKQPGNIWFVDSTHALASDTAGAGRNPDAPFATIDYAVGLCTANNADIIYVMPNHAENIATAGALTLDVQGLSVIGLGIGDDRPTLTWTAVDATVAVDDCDILVRNFMFAQGIDTIVTMFDVNADDFTLEDCEFVEAAAAQAVSFVDLDGGGANACDNFTMRRCRVIQRTAGADQVVDIAQVQDGTQILDCVMDVDCENACVYSPAIHTDCVIAGNFLHNRQAGDHAVEFGAAATGFIINNRLMGNTSGTILDPGSCHCGGNTETTAIDSPGYPTPVAIVDNAANILGANSANNTFDSTTVAANADGSIIERLEDLKVTQERSVVKTDGAVLNAADPLFTITGGPIMIREFVGIVTTVIGGAANMTIQETTTTPAATTVFSTTVAVNDDAAGTSYTFTAASPSVLTPTTNGVIPNVPRLGWLAPIGTIQGLGSAAQDGVIAWYMSYVPLSPASVVVAAA